MKHFVYGQKIQYGYRRQRFVFDQINIIGFYKKNTIWHPQINEISQEKFPCSQFACYDTCKYCGNSSGYTYAAVVCIWRDYLRYPRLICCPGYVEINHHDTIVSFRNPRIETYFIPCKEFFYRKGPVPGTGSGNKNYHMFWGRKSVFGSYRMSVKFSSDLLDYESENSGIIRFKNVRQKQAYIECGMYTWDRKRARRGKRSWKRCKYARKSWMKHIK